MSLQGWGKFVNAALLSLINEAAVTITIRFRFDGRTNGHQGHSDVTR